MRTSQRWLLLGAAAAVTSVVEPTPASAVIEPPRTIDGPSADIIEFGGVALAADGTGGLAYVKAVGGIPHVFVSRYVGGRWSAPARVDGDQPFDAASPRIAAAEDGRLLVVWVTQVATVHGRIRRGLMSASLGPGAAQFGRSLLVDADVGPGLGVTPSLAGATPGAAIVAYRVVTNDFNPANSTPENATQRPLRPGDVMADVRVARLGSDRWSRLGAINRNSAFSMRAPSAVNGPQVGVAANGNAVVAWQEPDSAGVARIWGRRVFGTVPGPVLEASPATWAGAVVTDDADALALDVTRLGQAEVAIRVSGGARSSLGGSRVVLNTLPVSIDPEAKAFTGAVAVDGDTPLPGGSVGAPSVAAVDGGQHGTLRVGYAGAGVTRLVTVDDNGRRPAAILGASAAPDAQTVTAVNPAGGGVAAWNAVSDTGTPGVALRQDFPSGASQAAFLTGTQAGPVDGLSIGRAGSGDAIVAFQQGVPGRFEIVASRISVPPASLAVTTPIGWVRPRAAVIRWEPASTALSGGVGYSVVIDGQTVAGALRGRSLRPSPDVLGSGIRQVRVVATDSAGQQVASPPSRLRVDARPPTAKATLVRKQGKRRTVVVKVTDQHSGVNGARTTAAFGDRTKTTRGRRTFRHTYKRSGRYRVVVKTRDKVGNTATIQLRVRVR